jgi:hypothetical protein
MSNDRKSCRCKSQAGDEEKFAHGFQCLDWRQPASEEKLPAAPGMTAFARKSGC